MSSFSTRKARIGGIVACLVICGAIAAVEGHHAIPAFRAWTFGLVSLLLAILTSLTRGRARDGLLMATTLMVTFAVLEAGASVLEPKSGFETTPGSLVARPIVGWGFGFSGIVQAKQIDRRTGAVVFDVHYTIDKTLNRIVKATDRGPAIVFFGGSFTFGVGVNDADTLPQRFADLYGGSQRTVDLAVSGYGPQQFLRQVQTGVDDAVIGPKPAAFVFLTSPFHAMRTSCKEPWTNYGPRFKLVDGKPLLVGRCYEGLGLVAHEFLQNTAIYRTIVRPFVTRLTHADIDLYIAIIAEATKVSKEKYHVDTLVPFVRFLPGYLDGTGYDDDSVMGALRARGVDIVDMTLVDDPSTGIFYSIRGDGHPSPAANMVRAQEIARALKDRGIQTEARAIP